MDKDTLKKKIADVMGAVLGVDPSAINDDSSMDTVASWDSLKHMKLVIVLEQEFGVEFDDEEVVELLSFRLIELSLSEKVLK